MTETDIQAMDAYREHGEIVQWQVTLYGTAGIPITDRDVAREAVSFLFGLRMAEVQADLTGGFWAVSVDGPTGHLLADGHGLDRVCSFSGYRAVRQPDPRAVEVCFDCGAAPGVRCAPDCICWDEGP